MAIANPEIVLRCEQCGAPLAGGFGGCLNCLLLGGEREPAIENRRFQHYEICLRPDGATFDELGRGAMGITYRALDTNLNSPVALKVINARYSENAQARERFRHEARAAAQLRHPNVASVYHFGETDAGQCYYAMELVEGETLETCVRRDGALPPAVALEIVTQVARALLAAEARGLVHRDLKPSNLMVAATDASDTDQGLVKVIDFGLAKGTAPAGVCGAGPLPAGFSGTPDFASPEQLGAGGHRPLDTRSDIYSLGVTLWYLLCGRPPFAGRAHGDRRDGPIPLEDLAAANVPAPVVALLRSMLATDPTARPQSAGELLAALRRCRQAMGAPPRRRAWLPWAALLLAVTAAVAGLTIHGLRPQQPSETAAAMAPEKSIAVLPFDSLSEDKENAFFAAGVQDEILSSLARIAYLKVTSRNSVTQYKVGAARNRREIAQTLGVAQLLEGSVQRAGDRVRVSVQLIDARADTQRWAQTFDHASADVFSIQSEIASAIANELQAKLSPAEKTAIAEPPTADLAAYALYTEARALAVWADWKDGEKSLSRQIELLKAATARDPNFVLAHCLLARTYSRLYPPTFTDERDPGPIVELWKPVIDTALALRPDLGQPHVELAWYYLFTRDFDRAHTEATVARRLLPNDAEAGFILARVERRQNHWETALAIAREAYERDTRNGDLTVWIAETFCLVRRYREGEAFIQSAVARLPEISSLLHGQWAQLKLAEGDLRGAAEVLAKLPATSAFDERFTLALFQRDFETATRILATAPSVASSDFFAGMTRAMTAGELARARGDTEAAQTAFREARQIAEAQTDLPSEARHLYNLARIDAGLGRKAEALREARRAVELCPIAADAIEGTVIAEGLALVCAWTGERDEAMDQLEKLAKLPAVTASEGDLRFHPRWDALRGDPRFEKLVASLGVRSAR